MFCVWFDQYEGKNRRENAGKLEHSDFTTQEQKKKVAIAINERLYASVSADCTSSLSGKNSEEMKKNVSVGQFLSVSLKL